MRPANIVLLRARARDGRDGRAVCASARLLVLVALAGASLALYARLPGTVGSVARGAGPLFAVLLPLTLAATAGGLLILAPAAGTGKRRELGVILIGGLAFRALLFPQPPALSHDAYRYVWDAQLVAHGVSPYLHAVTDPALAALRDAAIWPLVNWRDSPTIYPPGAQLFFLVVHLVAPLNLVALKAAMAMCDLLVCGLTLLLLRRHRLDRRRVVLYWWNPIPVLEYVYTGHVDVLAVALVLGAILLADSGARGARFGAGALLGAAVTVKLYPLLFAFALARRRDRSLLAGLAFVVLGVYLPFLPFGAAGGGFLGTYFSQRFVDQGIVFRLITTLLVQHALQMALQALWLVLCCAGVVWLRTKGRLAPPAAVLALSAAWIVVSPHLFPWYVGALLPFLALCLQWPIVSPRGSAPANRAPVGPHWALALWLFTLAMPFTYVIFAAGRDAGLFVWFFFVPLAAAAVLTLASRRSAGASPAARAAATSITPAAAALSAPASPRE